MNKNQLQAIFNAFWNDKRIQLEQALLVQIIKTDPRIIVSDGNTSVYLKFNNIKERFKRDTNDKLTLGFILKSMVLVIRPRFCIRFDSSASSLEFEISCDDVRLITPGMYMERCAPGKMLGSIIGSEKVDLFRKINEKRETLGIGGNDDACIELETLLEMALKLEPVDEKIKDSDIGLPSVGCTDAVDINEQLMNIKLIAHTTSSIMKDNEAMRSNGSIHYISLENDGMIAVNYDWQEHDLEAIRNIGKDPMQTIMANDKLNERKVNKRSQSSYMKDKGHVKINKRNQFKKLKYK